MPKKMTNKIFIERSKIIHNDKYDYSNIDYVNSVTKINIFCNEHGSFLQTPSHHLSGHGCRKCQYSNLGNKLSLNKNGFVKKSKLIHGDRYDYSLVDYLNNKTKVEIVCKHHGSFFQRPDMHIGQKQGCPICNKSNIFINSTTVDKMKNKNCILYLLEFINDSESFLKIGITTLSIKERFRGYGKYQINVIYEYCSNLYDCYSLEQLVLNKFDLYYINDFKFKGKTECFSLNLKNNILDFLNEKCPLNQ